MTFQRYRLHWDERLEPLHNIVGLLASWLAGIQLSVNCGPRGSLNILSLELNIEYYLLAESRAVMCTLWTTQRVITFRP